LFTPHGIYKNWKSNGAGKKKGKGARGFPAASGEIEGKFISFSTCGWRKVDMMTMRIVRKWVVFLVQLRVVR